VRPGSRHIIKVAGQVLLDLYACFLIPAYTLLFAGGERWFGTNFSVLALLGVGQFWGFVVWGVVLTTYFLVVMILICRTLERYRTIAAITVLACLSLAGTLLLPYAPEIFPAAAQLHVMLAFSSCVLLMLALLLVLLRCRGQSASCRRLLWAWGIIALVSGVLLAAVGKVSIALEVWFVITTALLARSLLLRRVANRDIT